MFSLAGKKAVVLGIANEQSIAYGCAKAFRDQGAALAVTYLNAAAEPHVRPLATELGAELVLPLDVRDDGQFAQLFAAIREHWGRVDICLHSIARARIFTAASSIVPVPASARRWIHRSIPSSAWSTARRRSSLKAGPA